MLYFKIYGETNVIFCKLLLMKPIMPFSQKRVIFVYLFVRGSDALQVEGIEDIFSSDDQSFPSLIQ